MTATALNVYQKMVEAAKIIGSQEWVKAMKNGQYSSIPIDDMRAGVREACVKVGLVHVGPYDIDYNRVTVDRSIRMDGVCKFKYINAENPEEWVVFDSMGEAMDNGDKCTGKFITNLIKNHYKACWDIGEQGKDDIDSYSNEEYYRRIGASKPADKPAVKTPVNPGNDKLFKMKEEPAGDETAKDRPLEVKLDYVRKYAREFMVRERLAELPAFKNAGHVATDLLKMDKVEAMGEDIINALYVEILNIKNPARKGAN